jgi:hypothetical protein
MIIYSVTVIIKKDVESKWLKWMKEVHIPDVMNTGYFFDWQMQKLILPEDTDDDITYVINYQGQSFETYKQYVENEAPRLRNEHKEKFKNKFKATRSVYSFVSK